jgi:hypothetical protein
MRKLVLGMAATILFSLPIGSIVKADDVVIKDRPAVKERVVPPRDDETVVKERAPRRDNDKVIIKEK